MSEGRLSVHHSADSPPPAPTTASCIQGLGQPFLETPSHGPHRPRAFRESAVLYPRVYPHTIASQFCRSYRTTGIRASYGTLNLQNVHHQPCDVEQPSATSTTGSCSPLPPWALTDGRCAIAAPRSSRPAMALSPAHAVRDSACRVDLAIPLSARRTASRSTEAMPLYT